MSVPSHVVILSRIQALLNMKDEIQVNEYFKSLSKGKTYNEEKIYDPSNEQLNTQFHEENIFLKNLNVSAFLKSIADTKCNALQKNECSKKISLSKSQSAPQINPAPNCDSIKSELVAANASIEKWQALVSDKQKEIDKLEQELIHIQDLYMKFNLDTAKIKGGYKNKSKSNRRTRRRRSNKT